MTDSSLDFAERPLSPAIRMERTFYRHKDLVAVVWFVLALGMYLAGNGSHGLWDRDEPRYAVATREMIRSGDWIVPRFNGDLRPDKPPLIYWLMSVPMRTLGPPEFAARFVSSLAGAGVVVLVFLISMRTGCSVRGASVASCVAALSALHLLISKAATTDAVLSLTVCAAMLLHWQQRLRFSWGRHLGFWAVLGVSALVKGPPGPMIVGLAVVGGWVWRRLAEGGWFRGIVAESDFHSHLELGEMPHMSMRSERMRNFSADHLARTLAGIALFLAVTLPWAVAVWLRTDGEFFFGEDGAIRKHVVQRAAAPMEGHGGPFLLALPYYVPVLILGLLPMTPLAVVGLRWSWSRLPRPEMRYLWAWFAPSFLAFTLAGTKLPHYVAPLVPPLAIMAGHWWTAYAQAGDARLVGPGLFWWRLGGVFAWAMAGVALLVVPVALLADRLIDSFELPSQLLAAGLPPAVVLAAAGVAGGVAWVGRRPGAALRAWGFGMAIGLLVAMKWTLPHLEPLRPSRAAMAWIEEFAPTSIEVMAAEYREPSLVFYANQAVTMYGNYEHVRGIERLSQEGNPVALVAPASRWEKWRDRYLRDEKTGEPIPGRSIPDHVSVRWSGDFYDFQSGRPRQMVIVGNW